MVVTDEAGDHRRECEVRQLDGAALMSCRTRTEWPGFPSGWCRTEVPELQELDRVACDDPRRSERVRFVGAAYPWRSARIRQVCNLER
jgi:hypothetical protein